MIRHASESRYALAVKPSALSIRTNKRNQKIIVHNILFIYLTPFFHQLQRNEITSIMFLCIVINI